PFLGTNLNNSHLAARYGPAALANPIGLSCLLLSGDGYALLGRRNDSVAYYPGRVHPFSGALEPADDIDVFAEIRRELREELSLSQADIHELVCAGIAEDRSLRQPEMIFAAQTGLDRRTLQAQLDPREHQALWSVGHSAQAFDAALRGDVPFTPVGVAALLLWGRIAFGDDWFVSHQQRMRG
ncbi:MAG TPA: NUDIX hydrolase, partial [Tepidisphaeraceae bacterium]|nr:NUDIX hydrolase [Tepidisphaeraceae bacterium]